MKENITPLENSWRNFRSDVDGAYEKPKTTPKKTITEATTEVIPPYDAQVTEIANNSGGDKPLGLSKFHNNVSNINKRFEKNETIAPRYIKTGNIVYNTRQNKHVDWNKLTNEQRKKMGDIKQSANMSRINKYPAKSQGINLINLKNRRLQTELARVISRLAEDNMGVTTDGDDFWDCNRLALRKVNRESIFKCKESRESHSIIIVLDSSPSCSEYANFYSKLASQIVKYGDVDLFDGPNARLVHKYSSKSKQFVQFLTKEDIFANVHRWSLYKNRQIIFFGDEDGIAIVQEASVNNTIHYFFTGINENLQYFFKTYPTQRKLRNINVYEKIRNVDSFMRATKKIK